MEVGKSNQNFWREKGVEERNHAADTRCRTQGVSNMKGVWGMERQGQATTPRVLTKRTKSTKDSVRNSKGETRIGVCLCLRQRARLNPIHQD